MKKKAGPVSGTKTAKKAPSTKAASKKKVATKATKTSKRKAKLITREEGEIPPTEALGITSNDYVNVIESGLVNQKRQLKLQLQAKAGGQINFFGFRVENKNGELLEFVQPPDWDENQKVKLTFNIPEVDRGFVDVSDYTVVILTKKKLY